MITHIKKRNGSIEEFSPTKINGWGEWASKKLGPSVDWGSVVIDAVNRCPSVCSSSDLQNALIETCLSRKTWEYNKMAGRLYASLIEREMYPTGRPTVKKLHQTMYECGLMVKLDYTDQEYEQIEKIIDHKRDLTYPHYQLNQLRLKYALRNKATGQEYESPQFIYMRMAMALAEHEPAEQKLRHLAAWYDHLSHNRINAPTPYYVNLGTKLNGYASCCLYTTDDTAQSLAAGDHIAYMMTCMSAGIGTHIKTRSLGDPVRGGLIQHQGKLPYYRAMVGAIGANLQNGRGGASTVHYNAFDPEVEVIQKLRHPMTPLTKKISGCHYSFGNNKLFARKVAKNQEYAPFSYYDQADMYEAMFEKDQSRFEKLYTEYEKTAPVKLNAREIALGALTQAYETGVHYLHNIDLMNHHTPFKDKIYLSNLCLTGDTRIEIMLADSETLNISLGDFVEQWSFGFFDDSCKVKSYNTNTGEQVWSTVSNAGKTAEVTELYEIEDESGNYIRCTADHLIFTENRGYVKAKDLVETDVLRVKK
jgi:ribonucleoside-diphosphate reductase alpha chain